MSSPGNPLVALNSQCSPPGLCTCGPSTFVKLLAVPHQHKNKGSVTHSSPQHNRSGPLTPFWNARDSFDLSTSADIRQQNAVRRSSRPMFLSKKSHAQPRLHNAINDLSKLGALGFLGCYRGSNIANEEIIYFLLNCHNATWQPALVLS